MIEVELHDVLVRVEPEEEGEGERIASRLRVVLLKEKGGPRVLPIWVGAAEGDALALELGDELPLRPLTADLMARLLEISGVRVERVAVSSFRETTFYATVTVSVDGDAHEVEARPSDALNLAARLHAPIFVDAAVFEECGFTASDGAAAVAAELDRITAESGFCGPEERASGLWRSLSPQLVKSVWPSPEAKE